jgi:hypothetical protein
LRDPWGGGFSVTSGMTSDHRSAQVSECEQREKGRDRNGEIRSIHYAERGDDWIQPSTFRATERHLAKSRPRIGAEK